MTNLSPRLDQAQRLCSARKACGVLALLVGFSITHLAAAADVSVAVDFGLKTGKAASQRQWGLNLFQGFDPLVAGLPGNAAYRDNVAFMHPGMVRYHSWEMMNASTERTGWLLNPGSPDVSWDADKIAAALSSLAHAADAPDVVINIPSWPTYMKDEHGKLKPDDLAAWGEFCASLVRIVNIQNHCAVRYWEVPNEADGAELYGGDGAALGDLVKAAADAMKAVDPTIKVGGAAFTHVYVASIPAFLDRAGNDIDFVSYHAYSTGNGSAAPKEVWDSAAQLGSSTTYIQGLLHSRGLDHLETFHDEYNVSYAPPDPKMTNEVGMVFDALAMISLANSGVSGAMAWNEADGWYGKLDGAWAKRPAANVYHLFNRYLSGDIVSTTSTDPAVVSFAVAGTTSDALVLVHRDDARARTVSVELTGSRIRPDHLVMFQATAGGLVEQETGSSEVAVELSLPATSVTLLTAVEPTIGAAGSEDAGASAAGACANGCGTGGSEALPGGSPATEQVGGVGGGAAGAIPSGGAPASSPLSHNNSASCGCRVAHSEHPPLLLLGAIAAFSVLTRRRSRWLRRQRGSLT